MSEGIPFGHLADKTGSHSDKFISQVSGLTVATVKRCLAELESRAVFSRTDSGVIFSRRMVHDEDVRKSRAEGGRLGGNPRLKGYPEGYPYLSKEGLPPSDSDSNLLSKKKKDAENPLHGAYHDFVARWANPTDVDFGCQVWIGLVDNGSITEPMIPDIYAGLERWKTSKQWYEKQMVPGIAKWLKEKRWKDNPPQCKSVDGMGF